MTYEELVRRANMKSSICLECGCFVSSLLDCCPACGWSEKETKATTSKFSSLASNAVMTVNEMRDHYNALGGNSAVEKIAEINNKVNITRVDYDYRRAKDMLDMDTLYFVDNVTINEYCRRQSCVTFDDIEASQSYITRIPSADRLGDIRGLPGQVVHCADTNRCYVCYKDYQWQQLYDYAPDVDYTAYYKTKSEALQAQQHTMQLYEDAIKSIKAYPGYKDKLDTVEGELEYVKNHYL